MIRRASGEGIELAGFGGEVVGHQYLGVAEGVEAVVGAFESLHEEFAAQGVEGDADAVEGGIAGEGGGGGERGGAGAVDGCAPGEAEGAGGGEADADAGEATGADGDGDG